MCTINGFTFKNDDLIRQMNRITKHRGPDATRKHTAPGISLGHNRLSIIDLNERSAQPMWDASGRFAIVYNGELYNFKEIKKELQGKYTFRTKSDTEVVLYAYIEWGEAALEKFDGMFAFAVWDSHQEKFFLARDHAGIKPLYYYQKDETLIFSSEIKAILEHDIPRKLDYEAFNHYLRVHYVPAPLTMFKDVKKLPISSYAVWEDGDLQIHSYEKEVNPDYIQSAEGQRTAVFDSITQSIQQQLISDRPVGIYLSGGIDSSILAHTASKVGANLDTFSVGFEMKTDELSDKFNADMRLAERTADHYGLDHHKIYLQKEDILEYFKETVWHLDEPVATGTSIAMYKLADFAKQGVDVVLSGDGGDELFGGYRRYRLSRIASLYQKFVPAFVRRLLEKTDKGRKLNKSSALDRFILFRFLTEKRIRRVVDDDLLSFDTSRTFFQERFFAQCDKTTEECLMEADRKDWLPNFSLSRTDKIPMAHGLEQRVPLLGKDVIATAERIPTDAKLDPIHNKKVLKQAFRPHLPDFLFNQPKRGFFFPGAKWLRRPKIDAFAREVLSPRFNSETRKLFDWEQIEALIEEHKGDRYHYTQLWSLLTFQLWASQFDVEV